MTHIEQIYLDLLELHGPQGWWPVSCFQGVNPTRSGNGTGYHPNNYSIPTSEQELLEICIGAILTQNTSWPQVEKALQNLSAQKACNAEIIMNMAESDLKNAIRPSGYFNQKAKKLLIFCDFFLKLKKTPTREQLLALWGIGPETADSILLYGYHRLHFVVDNYTKRIFNAIGITNREMNYDEIQRIFTKSLPKDIVIYQEYHALIVEHAKCYFSSPKSEGLQSPILQKFSKSKSSSI